MLEDQLACSSTSLCPQMRFACKVCSAETKFYHFGMQLCRGCGTFFQRCIRNGKRYECKNEDYKCNEQYDVSAKCKACRYAKCLKVWSQKNENAESSHLETHNFHLFLNGITSVSHQLVKAYQNFYDLQADLVAQRHSIDKLTYDKNKDMYVATRASMNTLFKIFIDCISCLRFTTKESWTGFTADSQFELFIIQQCYLDSLIFPNIEDKRHVLLPGYISNMGDNMEQWWFEPNTEENERRKYRAFIKEFNDNYQRIIHAFKKAKPNILDVGVIMLMTFLRHYESQGLEGEEQRKYKDRVLKEWAQNLRLRYEDEANEKLVQLIMLCDESAKLNYHLTEISAYISLMRANGAKLIKWTCIQSIPYPGNSLD